MLTAEPNSKHFAHVIVGTGQSVGTLLAGLPDDETVAVIEFAQVFARFGSQVTAIEAGPQLMFWEDADVASEHEAIANGHRVLKATRRMDTINRAREMGETKGFVKLLVDGDTDLFLGASIVGVNGDEIINMLAAFMYSGLPWQRFRRAVLVHPTVSELIPWILDGLEPMPVPSEPKPHTQLRYEPT
ncbi:MAG: NAD-binding protein [Trueperaceae bacterium]